MADTMTPVASANTTVATAATAANRANMVPMVAFTSSSRRAPVYCPMRTVPPAAKPEIKPVRVCISWLPVATAETPAASPKRPTIIRSTAP